MANKLKTFTKGFFIENPLLVLNIGLCSSLGVTTSIFNGLGISTVFADRGNVVGTILV